MSSMLWYTIAVVFFCWSCSQDLNQTIDDTETPVTITTQGDSIGLGVEVIDVGITNSEEQFRFSVTLKSPDTGCDQYADWWEIITPDSILLQRRILTHSHVNEQPFTRSGTNISILPDQKLIVRGHMNNLSFGRIVMTGTINDGFILDTLPMNYATSLEHIAPLPEGCAF